MNRKRIKIEQCYKILEVNKLHALHLKRRISTINEEFGELYGYDIDVLSDSGFGDISLTYNPRKNGVIVIIDLDVKKHIEILELLYPRKATHGHLSTSSMLSFRRHVNMLIKHTIERMVERNKAQFPNFEEMVIDDNEIVYKV